MELGELQQYIRTLATLEVSEALVINCYLDVEAGVQSRRNAFSGRVAILRRNIGTEYAEAFEQALTRVVSFIKDDLLPGSIGVAAFARVGASCFA